MTEVGYPFHIALDIAAGVLVDERLHRSSHGNGLCQSPGHPVKRLAESLSTCRLDRGHGC
jgi:hypothetical protein